MKPERKFNNGPDIDIYLSDIFDGKLVDDALQNFNNICQDHCHEIRQKWPNAIITFDVYAGEYYTEFYIKTKYPETDQELYDRLNKEEATARKNKETRFKNYLVLKQEFDPD